MPAGQKRPYQSEQARLAALAAADVKAWGYIDDSGAINAGFNVASVTKLGTGSYRVNLTTPFASTSYVVVVTCGDKAGAGIAQMTGTMTTSTFQLGLFSAAFAAKDNSFHFIAFGA
jgi:hypothetical protein